MLRKIFSKMNLTALLLCMLILALIIVTADTSPTWVYGGF